MELRLAELSPSSRQALLAWFRTSARKLPWRNERTPHRVWISEIMLQQTQVATVIPYFNRFVEAFPTATALADAPEDQVMALWAGLGYYSRARKLIACAREQVAIHGGALPARVDALRALPGFGPYTVAAVGSLAFGMPLAVLDGNVIRVLSRVSALEEEVSQPATRGRLQAMADRLLERASPGEWNEALMELGATCCLPRQARCQECPLKADCLGFNTGRPLAFPVKERRATPPSRPTLLLVVKEGSGRVLARRRGDEGMLRGLWELPCAEGDKGAPGPGILLEAWERLKRRLVAEVEKGVGPLVPEELSGLEDLRFTHSYTHFKALVRVHCFRAVEGMEPPEPWKWLDRPDLKRLGFSSRDRRVVKEMTP